MKHSIFTFISVAAATAVLFSCAKEADLKNQIEPEVKGFKVNVLAGDESKTYVEDGTVPVVKWSASDKIVLIESMDGAVQGTGISNAASISSDLAQFSTTIDWDATGGSSYTYSAVYPADAFISYNSKYYLYMPSVQTLEGNNLSSDSDILFSVVEDRGATRVADGEDLMFSFRRLGTVVRLTLKGITAGEKINRVVITAPNYIAGAIEYDPVTSTVDPSTAFVDAASDEITLNVDELTATGEDVVWFRVLAESDWAAGDAVTFKVITDKNIYKKDIASLPRAIKFPDGGLTKFGVDLSGSVVAPLSLPYSESFEASVDDWTFIDSDGDGYGWGPITTYPNTGTYALSSASYISSVGALTPDNWAFTPQIQLSDENYLSFYVRAVLTDYPEEHYAVYIADSTPMGAITELMPETEFPKGNFAILGDDGIYERFVIKIPDAFKNKVVCIGFRHFNCTDQYWLNIDDVEVTVDKPKTGIDALYSDYLGDWADGADKITIAQKVDGVSYYISGLAAQGSYQIEAAFDDGRLILYEQLLASSGTTDVFLQGSDGYYFPTYPTSLETRIFIAEYDKVNNKIDISPASSFVYYMIMTYENQSRADYAYSQIPSVWTVYVPDITTYIYQEDFEDDNTADWTFIDADGDGYYWYRAQVRSYSGSYALTSASYDNTDGALLPDNWAFTPAVTLTSNNYLSFWIRAQDPNWSDEHYAVYITDTAPDVNDLSGYEVLLAEQVYPNTDVLAPVETSSDGYYQRFVIPIPSTYNGTAVYIGFRHFNCTDMFMLNIDDVAISEGSPVISSPNPAPAKPRTIAASKTSQFNLWTPSLKGKAPQSRISIENTARKVR